MWTVFVAAAATATSVVIEAGASFAKRDLLLERPSPEDAAMGEECDRPSAMGEKEEVPLPPMLIDEPIIEVLLVPSEPPDITPCVERRRAFFFAASLRCSRTRIRASIEAPSVLVSSSPGMACGVPGALPSRQRLTRSRATFCLKSE